MINIITEKYLTKEETERYSKYNIVHTRDQEVNMYRVIAMSTQVGFILHGYYQNTLKQIYYALAKNKKVQVRDTDGTIYNIKSYEAFNSSKLIAKYHAAKKEYIAKLELKKEASNIQDLLQYVNLNKVPEDLDFILRQYSYNYDIMYSEKEDMQTKLRDYIQIKYYLEHDIPFDNIKATNPMDEAMFNVTSFGNESYMEDHIYKNGGSYAK